MLGRNTYQSGSKQYGNPQQSQHLHTPKNYINYISFQTNPTVIQREPDHVSLYSLNIQQHPQPRSGTPNGSTPINRNAYLNAPVEPRRQPPKQSQIRNTSSKEPFGQRQSQQLSKNKTQSLKNSVKANSQSSHRISNDFYQTGINVPSQIQFSAELSSPNCSSKTVDLGAISRQRSSEEVNISNEEQELKNKINYLQVIEQSLLQFEKGRQPKDLKQLNEDNRLLMLKAFEQMNRVKQANKRPINESVTESDNMSQDALSIEEKSQGRTNSLRVTSEKRKFIEGLSRSKQKDKDRSKQVDNELRINQRLKHQYEQQLAKYENKKPSQLDQLDQAINFQQQQIQKYNVLNSEISSSLNPLPFFRQWKIMCDQAEGAKKTSFRIKQEIIKRKQKLKQFQSGTQSKIQVKIQQTSSHQDLSKGRDSSVNKAKPLMNIMKIPPSPINRPQGNSIQSSSSNRTVQESTLRMGENRPKSINRSSTNN